ncbi:hypothetical protein JRO89_XSUnG0171700 [Xanthoceras sorbifolium]|uniref:Uncharacterized protein n=1 Tax=Xanthoceras sorbifolium TaxID=99658 RepID=A0ABQ8GXL7_9ROSI|nr:hypothetical protein JRO89_XSUnG0171700 [Xanthoceras sorbifolium]
MRKPDLMAKDRAVLVNNNTNKIINKLRKGLWSPEEDEKLIKYMLTNGQGCWTDIARNAGLQRCGKSCRLRWINYLRPDLKRGAFSPQEEELIIHLHSILGNRQDVSLHTLNYQAVVLLKRYMNRNVCISKILVLLDMVQALNF